MLPRVAFGCGLLEGGNEQFRPGSIALRKARQKSRGGQETAQQTADPFRKSALLAY